MKHFCNIIPEFCSPVLQEKIQQLYKNLEKQGLIPHDVSLRLNNFEPDDDNLFFVSIDKDTKYNPQNLMSKINLKTSKIVIIPNEKENFFDFAIKYNICNLIHMDKLNEYTLLGILKNFQTKDLCLDFFFEKEKLFDNSYSISGNISMLKLVENKFADFIDKIPCSIKNTFMMNCHELVTNAIAYGVLGITAYIRDKKDHSIHNIIDYANINIPQGKEVNVRLVMNKDFYGISVKDSGGLLTKQRILERIRRQSAIAGETIPLGIEDYTGRGLTILSHHGLLLFSIKPKISTEISLISRIDTAIGKSPISILAQES
ncbi:MAG: hypothetical protein LBU89_05355 [Fibromonadaceae bacterium]|jgi:hypothetical protein|nr:hypothetical protein [Fibromonadaceae bacterium]